MTTTPQTYAELRTAVVGVVVKGRQSIDRAWIETYHETGRLIQEHLLLKNERAAYGASVFARLSYPRYLRPSCRSCISCISWQLFRGSPSRPLSVRVRWPRSQAPFRAHSLSHIKARAVFPV